MPYILERERRRYNNEIMEILKELRTADETLTGGCAGHAAYVFYSLLQGIANLRLGGMRFELVAKGLGALEGAKAEFLRVDVAGYEDEKATENGLCEKFDGPPPRDPPAYHGPEERGEGGE